MSKPYYSNCLFYVLQKMWSDHKEHGRFGYLMWRTSYIASEFGITSKWHPASWVPHFLHRDVFHNVTQFRPTEEQRRRDFKRGIWPTMLISLFTLWWHEGVVSGDDEPKVAA